MIAGSAAEKTDLEDRVLRAPGLGESAQSKGLLVLHERPYGLFGAGWLY